MKLMPKTASRHHNMSHEDLALLFFSKAAAFSETTIHWMTFMTLVMTFMTLVAKRMAATIKLGIIF